MLTQSSASYSVGGRCLIPGTDSNSSLRYCFKFVGRYNSVTVMVRLRVATSEFDSRYRKIFLFAPTSNRVWETSSLVTSGHRSSVRVKRPERETDHTTRFRATVKKFSAFVHSIPNASSWSGT